MRPDGQAFPLYEGSEDHQRSFTYVGDIMRGLVSALRHFNRCGGKTINLGRPTSTSTLRVLELVADAVGAPLCIRRVPAREGDQRRTRAQIQRARRLLDFSPTTPLEEGIAAEAAWFAEENMSVGRFE